MSRKITLYTITGLKARILKLIVGTPILVVGALMLDAGLENPSPPYVLPFIGGIVAIGGVVACLSAFLNDELAITLGGDSPGESFPGVGVPAPGIGFSWVDLVGVTYW